MRRTLAVLFALSLVLTGCKAKELAEKEAISQDLQKRGTTELMQEIAKDRYTAPADGRLTDAQVQMYLKVREHEKAIVQVAKEELKKHAEKADKTKNTIAGMMQGIEAMGSAADLFTADLRAAKDLGYNTQEYQWVKQSILTVSTTQMAKTFSDAITSGAEKTYAEAKKAYDQAKDEQTKKVYADILAGYDKSRQEMTSQKIEEEPAVAYNRQLLSKYESALAAFAHELGKYEDKAGDAQKAMQDLEKKLQEAKKQ